jgi:hypothetical protein
MNHKDHQALTHVKNVILFIWVDDLSAGYTIYIVRTLKEARVNCHRKITTLSIPYNEKFIDISVRSF